MVRSLAADTEDTIEAEVLKCALLCPNCHKLVEATPRWKDA